MRALLLGTKGGPRLAPDRCGPGQLIEHAGRTVLVDAGEGVVQQIVRSGRSLADLDDVLVTHHHCDHNAALGNVLMGFWVSGADRPITVHGPPPLERIVAHLLAAHAYDIDTRVADEGRVDLRDLVHVNEIAADRPAELSLGPIAAAAAPVVHPPVHALAYRFTAAGGAPSIVVSGDTAPCRSLVELARGAEVLIHEVLHPDFIRPLQGERANTRWADLERHLLDSHTSVYDLGAVAADAGVATLVLSHLVPWAGVAERQWLDPVRGRFGGAVRLGHDLMSVSADESTEATHEEHDADHPVDRRE